jgi:hypothetical protein
LFGRARASVLFSGILIFQLFTCARGTARGCRFGNVRCSEAREWRRHLIAMKRSIVPQLPANDPSHGLEGIRALRRSHTRAVRFADELGRSFDQSFALPYSLFFRLKVKGRWKNRLSFTRAAIPLFNSSVIARLKN